MIELKDVLNIHNILIDKFGGSKGIRDGWALVTGELFSHSPISQSSSC
jgi:hypothetical protein